jgi:prevent-host-death family protein
LRIQLYSLNIGTEELLPMLRTDKNDTIVVSALRARANFGKLLRRVEDERRALVIEKRGTPKAVLLSIRDYVRLAAPEPEVLRVIGEESQRRGTDKLSSREIDQVIKATRAKKPKRG